MKTKLTLLVGMIASLPLTSCSNSHTSALRPNTSPVAIVGGNDARQAIPYPTIPQTLPPHIVVQGEMPMIVMETPIIIEERIWAGNDLWIVSYRGVRGANGNVRYVNYIPFRHRFIRGHHSR